MYHESSRYRKYEYEKALGVFTIIAICNAYKELYELSSREEKLEWWIVLRDEGLWVADKLNLEKYNVKNLFTNTTQEIVEAVYNEVTSYYKPDSQKSVEYGTLLSIVGIALAKNVGL